MFERIKSAIFESPASREIELSDTSVQVRGGALAGIAASRDRFLRGFDLTSNGSGAVRLANPYPQHVSVFRCVNLIATAVSTIPYKLRNGEKDVLSGPVFSKVAQPNELMNWSDLLLRFITDLLVDGNAFLLWDGEDLYPLPPSLMSPVMEKGSYVNIHHWEKSNGSGQKPDSIDPASVIHMGYAPSMNNYIMGIGPLVSAKIVVDADYASMWNNLTTLNGGGLPAGILKFVGKGMLTETMRNDIRETWRRTFGGPNAGSRLAVINQDWSWMPTGATNAELESTKHRDWNLSDICRAFNVPKLYLFEQERGAVGDATIKVHQKMFYYNCIIPITRRLEAKLNKQLMPLLGGRNIVGRFDFEEVEALRGDFSEKVKTAQILVKMGFSPNSVNKNLGLGQEDMPWGDDFLAPINLVPAQDIVDHEVVLPSGSDGKIGGIGSDQIDNAKDTAPPTKASATHWETLSTPVENLIDEASGRSRRALSKDRTRILSGDSDGFDGPALIEKLMPYIVKSFVHGYKTVDLNQDEALRLGAVYGNSRYEEIAAFTIALSGLLRIDLTETDKDRVLRNLLNRIIRKINDLCTAEIYSAYNHARYAAIRATNYSEAIWVAAPEARCDDSSNHGHVRILGEQFPTGHRYPGDRKAIVAVDCDCIICPKLS